MFENYLVTALRNIVRHKLYSFINIAGLAMALICTILIAVFVADELSYDKWVPGADRLWRVETTLHFEGKPDLLTTHASMPMLVAMREQIPEVRAATRLVPEHMAMVSGNRRFVETVGVTDPNFLQVIALPLMAGDPRTALSQPDSVVISQSVARKFFGDADPVGRTLTAQSRTCRVGASACDTSVAPLKVTGVMRDLPDNTQFDFDMLVPNTSRADQMEQRLKGKWLYTGNIFGYVALARGADPARVLAKLRTVIDQSVNVSAILVGKHSASQVLEPRLTPLVKVHLTSDNYVGAMKPAGDWSTLYGLVIIDILILLVACFNFMNLATARGMLRAREVSLRKCAGARRSQLISQFLCESVLMALFALVVALAVAEIAMPLFGHFMDRSLTVRYFADWPLTLGLIGVTLLAGLASGFYPAFVLSNLRPATALRGGAKGGYGATRLRTLLVTLQFAVSIALGLSAVVIMRQIDFAGDIDLGFDRSNVVWASAENHLAEEGLRSLVAALKRGPGVVDVARTDVQPFDSGGNFVGMQKPGNSQILTPNWISVSPNYFSLYHIRLVTGRLLSESEADTYYDLDDHRNEGHNIMVNVGLTRALGFSPRQIVGQIIILRKSHVRVVGVVGDTLVGGAHTAAAQTVYSQTPEDLQSVAIRLAPGQIALGMAHVNRTLRQFMPTALPNAVFLDDAYQRLYLADRREGEIFGAFVAVAVSIACLGMFGLAAFTVGRRTREIGIRKVFGARTNDIIWMLLWQFSVPVLTANAIAWPVAWYWLHGWLQGFAYRITLSPFYFVGAGAVALVIAWATVFVHARRVANANPIHALRYE